MIRNFLKVAWRNLVKGKTFTIINITGLAAGLVCFLLITLYVVDELSYDRFQANADRIFRVQSDLRFGGSELNLPVSSDMMGQMLQKDDPEVEAFTRIYASGGAKLIRKGNAFIKEEKVAHVDSSFFDVFSFPAIEGDTHRALVEPNTVVISESAARKYFGSTDVIGKTIETDDKGSTLYKITAVIRDMPRNSHFRFDFLFSMKNVDYNWGSFLSHNFYTYLLLRPGTDYHALEKKFSGYIDKYVLTQAQQFMDIKSMDDFEKAGNYLHYSLIPLTRIHLYSHQAFELRPSGSIQYVYIFGAVALFVLLIACINFMNLTTARSANRAREVGIRKVLGTGKKSLIGQFLTESTLMALFSLLLAIAVTLAVLPLFNRVADKSMQVGDLFRPGFILLMILLPFVVGLLAGSYPAFYLSAFRPIEVLKGRLKMGARHGGLRSVLVIFQFWISIILIIGTVVVYRQLNYIQNTRLGFNKDQVLIIDGAYALKDAAEVFKQEMQQVPGVVSGTLSSYLPVTSSSRSDDTWSKTAVLDPKSGLDMQDWQIDEDYLKTMGIELAEGRNFSKSFGTDSNAVILNETAARFLHLKQPVGATIYTSRNPGPGPLSPYHIIGVVKDFHFQSLHQEIGPLVFVYGKSRGTACFKIQAGQSKSILAAAERKWKELAPGMPFSYRFMDDSFNEMYRTEQRVGQLAMIFSLLTIIIACLGLFGLATFIAEQRTKEIGIRKVLGASVTGIVNLLSRDFVKLVFIASVLAFPVAWWAMHRWLQDFAYRIDIGWWIFLVAGGLALCIALVTVSFQAIRAALANPVKSLRTE